MSTPPPEKAPDLAQDLKMFELLPAKAKELALLKDRAEKTTGPEHAVITKLIQEKAK